MPSISVSIELPDLDPDDIAKTIKARIDSAHRQAFRIMLTYIRDNNLIPVDSGMSMGSFLLIAKSLRVAWKIGPRTKGGKLRKDLKYRYRPRVSPIKSPEAGAGISTKPEEVFVWRGNTLIVKFKSYVKQFDLHENSSFPKAWNVFRKALPIYEADLLTRLSKITKLKEYVGVKKLTLIRGRKTEINIKSKGKLNE